MTGLAMTKERSASESLIRSAAAAGFVLLAFVLLSAGARMHDETATLAAIAAHASFCLGFAPADPAAPEPFTAFGHCVMCWGAAASAVAALLAAFAPAPKST